MIEVHTQYLSGGSMGRSVITTVGDPAQQAQESKSRSSVISKLWNSLFHNSQISGRKRLRRKLFLLQIPIYVALVLLYIKFSLLIPGSRYARQDFIDHHPEKMSNGVSLMRFLFTTRGYVPDMAEGDQQIALNNLDAADKHFTDAIHHGGRSQCPVVINFAIVKEMLAERDVLQGHFTHSMQETSQALDVLKNAPASCLQDEGDKNKKQHRFITTLEQRLDNKRNQADQGTLFYDKVGEKYNFYYKFDMSRNEYPNMGTLNKCAGLEDEPKQQCIIQDLSNRQSPPDPKNDPSPRAQGGKISHTPPQEAPVPQPEKLSKTPPTAPQTPTKLDQGSPEQNNLTWHKNPKDDLADLLSDSNRRNHTNQ